MEIEQTSRSGPKLGGWLVEASANWASQVILTSGIALLYLVAMHRVVMLYGFANVFKLRGPLHGIALSCMVLHGITWYCMVFHGIAWYCMVLHGIAWYCMVLHCIAWYCMVLHDIAWY